MRNRELNTDGVASIQLRLMPTLIKKNGASSFWNSDPTANLYFLTLVIEDIDDQFKASLLLDSFPNIHNSDYIELRKILYEWTSSGVNEVPGRLFFISTVIRCRKKFQETSRAIQKIQADPEYQDMVQILSSTLSKTASFPFIVNVAIKISEIMKRYLGKIDFISLATTTHYFSKNHGDFDKIGRFTLRKSTRNVDFYFELIVHNRRLSAGIDEIIQPCLNYTGDSSVLVVIS